VALERGKINYYADGTLKYTSTQTPAYPLIVDSTLNTVGAGVQNAILTK
jgi:hypothetical protein